jgi:dynein light chain roadblock-type
MARLSSKDGVRAALVLDSGLGSIIHVMGSFSSFHATTAAMTSPDTSTAGTADNDISGNSENIGELAAMVWGFVKAAGGLVQGLDSEVIYHSRKRSFRKLTCNRMKSNYCD